MTAVFRDPLVHVVPMDVSTSTAEVWIGSLITWYPKFDNVRLEYLPVGDGGPPKTATVVVSAAQWDYALPKAKKGWFKRVKLTGLKPGVQYDVRATKKVGSKYTAVGQCFVTTLPAALPTAPADAFRVMVGSCFYNDEDNGRTAMAYKKLYDAATTRPHLKFVVGDAIYADIGMPLTRMSTDQIRARFLDLYVRSWGKLSSMLRRGSNVFLPDDHEFFNDFPFEPPVLPTTHLAALRIDDYRSTWTKVAANCVRNIESVSPVRILNIGSDLSFCAADLRTKRTKTRLLPAADFKKLTDWAAGLTSPGVLVLGQLLMRGVGNATDHNLADFPTQYTKLLRALASSGHDIVVLTGDIHFGRIASAALGESGARIIEVVASPMSNLTGIYSISTAVPDKKPAKFPPYFVPGMLQKPVTFHRAVSIRGPAPTDYLRPRTREHFATIAFNKAASGVEMRVDAWRVRSNANSASLPEKDYKQWKTTLT